MRELMKVIGVAVAVLVIYFGYLLAYRPLSYQPQFDELRRLVRRLEEYRNAKGSFPVQSPAEVPVSGLKKALAASGVAFRTQFDHSDVDPQARYVSANGKAYGILFHFNQAGSVRKCIVEMDTFVSGAWGQPPPCPL